MRRILQAAAALGCLSVSGCAGAGLAALPPEAWAAIGAGFGMGTAAITATDHIVTAELAKQQLARNPAPMPGLAATPGAIHP